MSTARQLGTLTLVAMWTLGLGWLYLNHSCETRSVAHVQRDVGRADTSSSSDSSKLDQALNGPPYSFTGWEDQALLAAAYRTAVQLGHADAGGLAKPYAYCLALGRERQDAPPAVIASLGHAGLRVRPASACYVNRGGPYAVTDATTSRRGWLLSITAFERPRPGSITLYASFYVQPLFAAGWACKATLSGPEQWTVSDCSMRWVS